ncbi:MAG: hypothetical protein ACUVXD_06550, partial [Thermodesulfobacteriota bacterium]
GPCLGREVEMEGMKKDARRDRHGKGCLALTALLALAISFSSCASIQKAPDARPGTPSVIADSQTRVVSEGDSEDTQVSDQHGNEVAAGQRGSVMVKDVIGALVVALLSPATWSAILQAIASHGFWP